MRTPTQKIEPQEDTSGPEAPLEKMSTRDRLLKFIAEGPYFTHEEGEEIRKMLREAREENVVRDIPA